MKQKRPDVFTFHDCRLYLNEICSYLKATQTGFNIVKLARDSKISKSYMSMVLNGERKISEPALKKILPYLGLSPAEENYLLLLREMSAEDSQIGKAGPIEAMQKLRSYQKNNPQEASVYKYLSRWYHVAIREMAALPGFQLNPEWIRDRLEEPIPLSDIEKGIEFLLEEGYLRVDDSGKVQPPDKRLECVDQVFKTAMLKYHEQVFSLAVENVPKLPMERKLLNAHMTAVSQESFDQIKALLQDTLEQIVKIAEKDQKPEMICQFSLLGFSLSKPPKKEEPSHEE